VIASFDLCGSLGSTRTVHHAVNEPKRGHGSSFRRTFDCRDASIAVIQQVTPMNNNLAMRLSEKIYRRLLAL
jgi:hypothetical protein